MASFGQVPNLLDERYLKVVQDVAGHVEPMPTLVPYDEYKHNIIVYRMNSDHDPFLLLIHDFTKRMSALLGKELWTWYVQWEVDNHSVSMPSPKKLRLQTSQPEPTGPEKQTQQRKPIIDQVHRCVIDPELIQEEELLRALINIVQVESSLVPNLIEFLYRWIDHLEGDGTALKAALKWEIPSLWDFDYHPILVPEELKERLEQENAELNREKDAMKSDGQDGSDSQTPKPSRAQELVQGSPTKRIRERPNLAAMERQIEESERLNYREVKYGIRPPTNQQPMPPLINIPRDEAKRIKYYNACYRSRHRALVLLLEAGITLQQISCYEKLQKPHPRDTPVNEDSAETDGLKHYQKDAEAGQDYFKIREKLQSETVKQNEIATSNRLADEARRAITGGTLESRSGQPLTSHAPVYTREPDMAANLWSKLQAAKARALNTINFVPGPLVGGMKSKYLARARDKQEMPGPVRFDGFQVCNVRLDRNGYGDVYEESDSEDDDDSGSDPDDSGDGDDDDDDGSDDNDDDDDDDNEDDVNGSGANPMPPYLPNASAPTSFHPSRPTGAAPVSAQPPTLNFGGPAITGPRPVQFAEAQAALSEYVQSLTPEEARDFSRVQQEIREYVLSQAGRSQRQVMPDNATVRPLGHIPTMPPTSTNTGPFPQMPSFANAGTPAGGAGQSQAQSTFMPLRPPTFARPPVRATVPDLNRPASTAVPTQSRPQSHAAPPAPSAARWSLDQFQIRPQAQRPFPATSTARPNPSVSFAPNQGIQLSSDTSGAYSQPPQVSRPPQVTMPTPPVLRFPPLSNMPSAPHMANQMPMMAARHGAEQTFASTLNAPQARSALHPPTPDRSSDIEHFLALQRQQEMQTQEPQQQRPTPVRPAVQHPTLQPHIMQPPRLQFRSMQQNASQNVLPTSSWAAAPTTLQRPTAPQFPPMQSQRPEQASVQHDGAQNMHQTMTRPTFSLPFPRPTSSVNTGAASQIQFPPPTDHVPLPGIQRNAPAPLNLQASIAKLGPLTSLAESILATTPFRASAQGVPIQIYFPKVVVPGNGIGPGGTKLGNDGLAETDALLLGYTIPGSGKITLERAIFMPIGCWNNTLKRVREGQADVLESYLSSFNSFTKDWRGEKTMCHRAAYTKLSQAFSFMTPEPKLREELLTKRWRVTPGRMTQLDRGAVWEGWGVSVDRPIRMEKEEREGVTRLKWVVDGSERVRSKEAQARWNDVEEWLEAELEKEDEDMGNGEDVNMEG